MKLFLHKERQEPSVLHTYLYIDETVGERIESLTKPPSPAERQELGKWIDTRADAIRQGKIEQLRETVAALQSEVAGSGTAVAGAEKDLNNEKVPDVHPTRYIRLAFSTLALLTCVLAEYQITLSTIPWFLDLKQNSPVALALAAIGAAALTGTEFGLSMLLMPYLLNGETLDKSRTRSVLVTAFAVLTVILNLSLVAYLSDAREVASEMRQQQRERTTGLTRAVDPARPVTAASNASAKTTVNRAVRLMGLAACVDGALFSILFMADGGLLIARFFGKRQQKSARKKFERVSADNELKKQALALATRQAADCESLAAVSAKEFSARYKLHLQRKIDELTRNSENTEADGTPKRRPLEDLIADTLQYEMQRLAPRPS